MRAAWIDDNSRGKADPSVDWRKLKRGHADADFHKALGMIIANIEVTYSEPEEKILLQNSESDGSMFVILNGVFDVQTLLFGRGPKKLLEEQEKRQVELEKLRTTMS